MTKIYNSILDLVGHTPLLKLNKFMSSRKLEAEIIAKLEYFNPAGSVKDRVALEMIEDAEKSGRLTRDSVIIEPTEIPVSVLPWLPPPADTGSLLPCRIP